MMWGLALMSATATLALVVQDGSSLRAAPREAAPVQATLSPGDLLEVRGEKLDYLQVWDHRRERGGFVRASQVKQTQAQAADAPELMHWLRFVRDTPGQEALGVGLAATWLQAAPAGSNPAEALDAIGSLAERLAQRANPRNSAAAATPDAKLSAQLDSLRQWGVRWQSIEQDGQMRLCYDGEAFRRVLALPGASPEQKARAALGLTRPDCAATKQLPSQQEAVLRWQTEVLARIAPTEQASLAAMWQQRLHMRRAAVWAQLAFVQTFTKNFAPNPAQTAGNGSQADAATASAQHALAALASVNKNELPDEDQTELNDSAIRVGASRWAAEMPTASSPSASGQDSRPQIHTQAGQPGETCVLLTDARHGLAQPLLRQCTWGVVWTVSARVHPQGKAAVLAVQTLANWRELWLMKPDAQGQWQLEVLPPATGNPLGKDLGVLEFAGWVPDAEPKLLLAREMRIDGRYSRRFEVMRLSTGEIDKQASTPQVLAAFQRWQEPAWLRQTVMLR